MSNTFFQGGIAPPWLRAWPLPPQKETSAVIINNITTVDLLKQRLSHLFCSSACLFRSSFAFAWILQHKIVNRKVHLLESLSCCRSKTHLSATDIKSTSSVMNHFADFSRTVDTKSPFIFFFHSFEILFPSRFQTLLVKFIF